MDNWSLRLSVRTRGFHPRKRGSIPLGTAIDMMNHFVYLIKTVDSKVDKTYVGYSLDPYLRLLKHNTNKGAKSTKGHKWKIIFKKKFKSKSKALKYEYFLKKNRKKRLSIVKRI